MFNELQKIVFKHFGIDQIIEQVIEKLDNIPREMGEYISLSIFDREKYDRIETLNYEVTCVGDITLSDAEKSVLRLHPKFSIIETL